MTADGASPRIAVVGGGLAGLAAAVALAERGCRVELFEARRRLGGRAASFYDAASGEWIDHCQHVGMGCCTNLLDFCHRTGLADFLRRDRVLYFFAPDGRMFPLSASRWLPAPLHLAPALLRMGYLSLPDRISIARAMLRLARSNADSSLTIGQWLREQGQSPQAIERFWSVVLVSALGEELDRASLSAARKVFVDGFLSHRAAYEIDVPRVSLGELYGDRLEQWFKEHGVSLCLGTPIEQIVGDSGRVHEIVLADGSRRPGRRPVDGVVAAVTWKRVRGLFDNALLAGLPELSGVDQIDAAPITGVHLWFDREITALPHAVLVGRLSQWLFNRGSTSPETAEHYYQVVISASRSLAGRERSAIVEEVVADLSSIWPAAREARLLRWRIVTEQNAVYSARPDMEPLRPPQQTSIANLALAGDWTRTGWPSTMEGAVRSGYLAAEAMLNSFGRYERIVAPPLKVSPLARFLLARPA